MLLLVIVTCVIFVPKYSVAAPIQKLPASVPVAINKIENTMTAYSSMMKVMKLLFAESDGVFHKNVVQCASCKQSLLSLGMALALLTRHALETVAAEENNFVEQKPLIDAGLALADKGTTEESASLVLRICEQLKNTCSKCNVACWVVLT